MLSGPEVGDLIWFWRFAGFGFLGFLLEAFHARVTADPSDRKCLLFLPLCPVYGLGGCVCALAEPLSGGEPLLMFLLGGAGCTAAEYAMGAWYEWCAGVPFWDYSGRAGSVRGRVCLSYGVLWGVLSLAAVYGVLPVLDGLGALVPRPAVYAVFLVTAADLAASHVLLHSTRDRACLRRYGFPRQRGTFPRRRAVLLNRRIPRRLSAFANRRVPRQTDAAVREIREADAAP